MNLELFIFIYVDLSSKEEVNVMKRIDFGKMKDAIEMPNLIENTLKSFQRFKDIGIHEVLMNSFPVADHYGTYELQYVSSTLGESPVTPEVAKEKNLTYTVPLKATFRLINKEVDHVTESEVFMGDIPDMTDQGRFISNGVERVIVSQIGRCPGVYFTKKMNSQGEYNYEAKLIPEKGVWMTFDIDNKRIANVVIDNSKKIPVTLFLKALGLGTNEELLELFNHNDFIQNTLTKEDAETQEDALLQFYKSVKPNDPNVHDRAQKYIETFFFDQKRYDVGQAGRFKLNKKLSIKARGHRKVLAEDTINLSKGDVFRGEKMAEGENEIYVQNRDGESIKIIGNGQRTERHLTKEDIVAIINYMIHLDDKVGVTDNIDHLSNRRLQLVGELIASQFQVGIERVTRIIREKMSTNQGAGEANDSLTPHSLIYPKPLVGAMREFLGSGQLSQFIDQVNPLSELANKRRTSALGPGGLSKERASIEARDVHYSHYGKICPIETPEGFSVGLIGSIASFAKVNQYGILETPYRQVIDGVVTENIHYLTADDEDNYYIAQASSVDKNGAFTEEMIPVRSSGDYLLVPCNDVDYVNVSPRQNVGVGAALIPFLENDDANRTVMGTNMQRQALPVLEPEEPWVGTGIEEKIALDTGSSYVAEDDGIVTEITEHGITVNYKNLGEKHYRIRKFSRTNNNTCFNHRVLVYTTQAVKKGDILVDSSSSNQGELAIGKNLLVAFMTWEGYNYEDAILINERLVTEEVLTSIIQEEFSIDVRDTKLGPERITRNGIPDTGERQLRDLDEDGIIRVGAKVKENDILVGKVTPKSSDDTDAAEQKILEAVFKEKIKNLRDNSLRVSHGKEGVVMRIIRNRLGDKGLPNDALNKGVLEQIKVQVAEKRKIRRGDKLAGRHGNKGVISKILPAEDMPHLPDGTPVDIALNPLGVPSRMNIGQIMETHLGMAARELGVQYKVPVFESPSKLEIQNRLVEAGLPKDGKITLYDGRTGEPFENAITVGVMYMLKLNHQVKDKMNARSTGSYQLVTQQPLGGKAQQGGQRFGEMEVWSLEAHGAAYTLREMTTLKSDDLKGRTKMYKSIVTGMDLPEPSVTESLKALIGHIRGLGMDIDVITKEGNSIFEPKKGSER